MQLCPVCDSCFTLTNTVGYSFIKYHSITQIPAAIWDKVVPEHHYLFSQNYLQLIEQNQAGKMDFIYLQVMQNEELVGILYFQVVYFHGKDLLNYFPENKYTGVSKYLLEGLMNCGKTIVRMLNLKLLVSGNIFMTGETGMYFRKSLTALEKGELLQRSFSYLLKQKNGQQVALIADMFGSETEFDLPIQKSGFNRIEEEPDMGMLLHPEWKTFDDYLAALSSKYRVRAKKVLSNSATLEVRDLSLEDVSNYEARLYELYRNVVDGVNFNLGIFEQGYFLAQKQSTPDKYRIFGYFFEGELIGFMSHFVTTADLCVHYMGMDYSVNRDLSVYPRMLYDVLRFGIENRLPKLHFGRTAAEIKSTIGATDTPTYGYLKHRNPIINRIIGLFTPRLKPREFVIRNPFR